MTSFTLIVCNYVKRIIFIWIYQDFIPQSLLKSSTNVKIIFQAPCIDDGDRNGERVFEGGLIL